MAWSRRRGRSQTPAAARYYHLTGDGELALASFKKQWRVFRDAVDEILDEGSQE